MLEITLNKCLCIKMANKKKKVTKTVTTTVTEEIIPTNERTHIICILDSSGSMSKIMSDSIGGFNTFLEQQRNLPDDATITVALFDSYTNYQILYDNVNIKEAKDITSKEWYPRGLTALYDAIGKTINADKARLAKLGDEAPSKVLVCIITDGLENDSREYKIDAIKKLIKDCENDDWNFVYLAANQDAFAVGSGFGISVGNTYTYTTTTDGIYNMSNTLNTATVSYRAMSSSDKNFRKMSKSLIDDKSEDTGDIIGTSGTITINGDSNTTTNYTIENKNLIDN